MYLKNTKPRAYSRLDVVVVKKIRLLSSCCLYERIRAARGGFSEQCSFRDAQVGVYLRYSAAGTSVDDDDDDALHSQVSTCSCVTLLDPASCSCSFARSFAARAAIQPPSCAETKPEFVLVSVTWVRRTTTFAWWNLLYASATRRCRLLEQQGGLGSLLAQQAKYGSEVALLTFVSACHRAHAALVLLQSAETQQPAQSELI